MTNLHAQHSKGWAGLSFVVLLIVSIFAGGVPPPMNADPSTIGAYLSTHRQGLIAGGWLSFPIAAFFLWFAVGMAAFLRRTSARDDGLPTYALITSAFIAASALVASLVVTALAYRTPLGGGLTFIWALEALAAGPFLSMTIAIFVFAVAHSMRRHGSGAAWLVWLGYLTALGQAVLTLGMFYPTGIPADNPVIGIALLALFVVWMAAASLHLIMASGGKEQSGVSMPA
ncbi:MAG TPA: hypothetical protein VGZ02_07450 [Candidatus Baltobacteraceae bacterium]|jgi:hypothetical protein|nr:hypothetical protein [Candidatus Baltobacteraceae bacterium]